MKRKNLLWREKIEEEKNEGNVLNNKNVFTSLIDG